MKRTIITLVIVVAILIVIYIVYSKYIRIDTENSTVNTGEEGKQTIKDYLIKSGMTGDEVESIYQAPPSELEEINEVNI